ncbi:LysR family transcriptional regulator [Noviherbaspirillum saxi]|uniref:LysR family transcriptional regulator n=1 Tax=Noviherbaspirillum saxi TaxID=2320863 RepID=A0A3A3FLH6_9BURK|nr:LysR family transcriptional regulator [Noviherbaspirillum saxi]RJF92215.1 LysR family transcriptional regulator [Noviherbaspirillum saxi]
MNTDNAKKHLITASKSGQGFLDPQQIDWNLLKSFYLVADLGSLTRAAAVLGLSQPTLSRQIAELETHVGAALFERLSRGLRLTEAGTALMEPARRMLAAAQAVSLAVTAQHRDVAGTVRITASEIMSAYVLPPIFAALRAAYPAIQIELVASNRIDNLLTREADIAIRMIRPQQAGLITRKIADYPMGFYAHEVYLAKHSVVEGNDEWMQYDWVGLDQSNQLIEGFREVGFKVDKSFFAFRTDNHIVGWQAVLAGLGVGITLQRVAQCYPQLKQVMQDQPLPQLPVWLTAHRELRDSIRIRAVFDFLADALVPPAICSGEHADRGKAL